MRAGNQLGLEQARPILLGETVSTKLYVQNPNVFFFLDTKTNKDG
jgi:hypothetical protein